MRNLVIVHEGTGTVIPLSDAVYLIDADLVAARYNCSSMDDLESVMSERPAMLGYRIDNHNMTHLFFGE